MNRLLQIANSIGIIGVVVVCTLQWQNIYRIDADRDRLELTRQSQVKQIAVQAKTIGDQAADLEDFRGRLKIAEDELKEMQAKLALTTAERNQLRDALPKWKAAVEARDAALKQAGIQLQTFVKQRDSTIAQFNDLAIKYNDLVKKVEAETNNKATNDK